MMSIKKSIHEWTNRFDRRAEMFAFRHPYLAYFVMFIVMPVLVLAAVFIGTAIIALLGLDHGLAVNIRILKVVFPI